MKYIDLGNEAIKNLGTYSLCNNRTSQNRFQGTNCVKTLTIKNLTLEGQIVVSTSLVI